MSTVNLGRVQGGGIFYSTASSGTSIAKSTLTPTGLVPLVGDCVVFPNGDLRKITAVSGDNITCGSVAANFKGEKGDTGEGIDDLLNGTKIVAKAEQDGNGNNIVDTYATKTELNNSLATKANTSGSYNDLNVGHANSADSATQAARATVANAATTAQLGQSGVPSASNDDKIVTTEYLYPGSAEGNKVSSIIFVYRGVTHTIRMNTSYGNTTSNWMRVVRSGNTVTIGWTLAINTGIVFNKATNYTIATGLPKAAHTENNYCVGIAPDGTVFTVYVNNSGQIILRPQTGNLTSQTVYLGCTYLTNEA